MVKLFIIILFSVVSYKSMSQEFLFTTKISASDIWDTFYANPTSDGEFVSEKMTKIKNPKTGFFDTTAYEISNLKGQTVYIFAKYNSGGTVYRCNINYKNRVTEDPLWHSDDTVVMFHRLFSSILPENSITSINRNLYHPRFKEDSNGTSIIKTTLFFSKKRSVMEILYEDLNSLNKLSFRKFFLRRGDYFILQK